MARNPDDDFSQSTKEALAKRAGNLCSFPGCDALTLGPSDESSDATSSTGMACHIASASGGPGARRYRAKMESAERRSIENGIWMCYRHGKLIDTDEVRFTIPMLKKWRELAEARARFLHEHGWNISKLPKSYPDFNLAESSLAISDVNSLNETLGDAIRFSCVPEVWGPSIARCVRDFVIELARNAFEHGAATTFKIETEPTSIELTDDGAYFDLWSLPEAPNAGGGSVSLKALLKQMPEKVVLVSERRGQNNVTVISRIADISEIENLTHCVVSVKYKDIRERTHEIIAHPSCKVVYVLLPGYQTPSDSISLVKKVKRESHDPRRLIFVLQDPSEASLGIITDAFPDSRIVCL